MVDITLLQGLWFVLVAVLIAIYFVLDGFDLGAGVLYPFIAKDEHDRALITEAIGPLWDGNEVWLLTAGGALFAAFPSAYATSFSGFYLPIMLVLFGLILRAVSLAFLHIDASATCLWDGCFFVGSLLPALLLGVALGNIMGGIEINAYGDYVGGFLALLDPFSLLCGAIGATTMVLLGASWLCVKLDAQEPLFARASQVRLWAAGLDIALIVLATAGHFALDYGQVAPLLEVWAVGFAALCGVALFSSMTLFMLGKNILGHLVASLTCVGLVGIVATTIFPNIIPATTEALSLSIASASSSEYALGAMSIIAILGIPLVLVYHVIAYRVFRGKISE